MMHNSDRDENMFDAKDNARFDFLIYIIVKYILFMICESLITFLFR